MAKEESMAAPPSKIPNMDPSICHDCEKELALKNTHVTLMRKNVKSAYIKARERLSVIEIPAVAVATAGRIEVFDH